MTLRQRVEMGLTIHELVNARNFHLSCSQVLQITKQTVDLDVVH